MAIKITIDQKTGKARFKIDEDDYQRLEAEATKLGVPVQDMLQAQLDAHARKMFPAAFKK